jgi:hypothetical protein
MRQLTPKLRKYPNVRLQGQVRPATGNNKERLQEVISVQIWSSTVPSYSAPRDCPVRFTRGGRRIEIRIVAEVKTKELFPVRCANGGATTKVDTAIEVPLKARMLGQCRADLDRTGGRTDTRS